MPHLAAQPAPAPRYQIHRYPTALIATRWLGCLGQLTLRPVLPQDVQPLTELVSRLSPGARRNRFHGAMTLSASHLLQMCCVDHINHLALVVTATVQGEEQLIADARYCLDDDGEGAEFALLVDESWQRHGIGGWALRTLQRGAAQAGLRWLQGDVLHDNAPMLALAQRCGFALSPDPQDERLMKAQHRLGAVTAESPRPRGMWSWLQRRPDAAASLRTSPV